MTVSIQGECAPRFARVREVFEASFEKNREVGAAIAFTHRGESVVDLWGGDVDREGTKPWQRDTIVNTYSTTKGMTALCAHRLIERGDLALDVPVAHYWPEFAQAGKDALPVRFLLSHRAGLPAVRKPLETSVLYDWDAMCAALAEQEPWWEPGTKQGYHPVTFGFLVGELIRRVSGRSVGRFFREEVAEPLGLDFHIGLADAEHGRVSDIIGSLAPPPSQRKKGDTSGKPGIRIKGPLADFYRDMADPSTMVGAAFNNPRQRAAAVNTPEWRRAEIPAANGHGTARALARVYGALACGGRVDGVEVLSRAQIDRASTLQGEEQDATLGGLQIRYGLGFMLRSEVLPFSPHEGAFGHPGAGGSLGLADPEAEVGFGYVMNRMKPGLMGGSTAYAVLRAFHEALADGS